MNPIRSVCIAGVLALAAACSGCSKGIDEHTVRAPQGHAVYKIWRPGGFIKHEAFEVALVYGFNDNRIVAEQLVEFLNREEPDTYYATFVED